MTMCIILKESKRDRASRNEPSMTPFNKKVLSTVLLVFLMEVYYSVCFVVHRLMRYLRAEDNEFYSDFRNWNTEIVYKIKTIITGMAILYLFYYLNKTRKS